MTNSRDWFKKIIKVLSIILTVGTFFFAYSYGTSLIASVDLSAILNKWPILIISIVCFVGFYLVMSLHWLIVCRIVDVGAKSTQMLVFFASQPYKYLPTSLFSFSFRSKYALQAGISLKHGAFAQLIENFNILGSGVLVTLIFLCMMWSLGLGILLLVVVMVALYLLSRINKKMILPFTKTRRGVILSKVVPAFSLMCFGWCVAGLSFILVNHALGVSIDLRVAIAASSASFVVSILAFFAPGGIGVRELMLSAFALQNSVMVLWRILTFACDMVVGWIAVLMLAVGKQKS